MSTKIQIGQPLEILHDAISNSLDLFKQKYQSVFDYDVNEDSFGIYSFDMTFAKKAGFFPLGGEGHLGEIRLRRLNQNLTELKIEDSYWLTKSPQTILDQWSWNFPDEVPFSERISHVESVFSRFRLMHDEIRKFVVDQLKEDRILFADGRNTLQTSNRQYVDEVRLSHLRQLVSKEFDLTKLIRLCEELNQSFSSGSYYATAALVRALIDHIPPLFGARSFSEYASSIAGKSIKASIERLDSSSRNIADAALHQQIRKREVLPTVTQVDFSNDLDVLLGEIIRKLS